MSAARKKGRGRWKCACFRRVVTFLRGFANPGRSAPPGETHEYLGYGMLKAARRGDMNAVEAFLQRGADPRVQERRTGATTLHYVAAYGARTALLALIGNEHCQYLIRDKEGRLPSEMAMVYGEDVAMARLLMIKEKRQARSKGLRLTRRATSSF